MNKETKGSERGDSLIIHPIPPVWNSESKVLILGTMPSPKSREKNFFYMHPQNRFWSVLPQIFGETLITKNNEADNAAAITERQDFLLCHKIALWDVLASCKIKGAADSTICEEIPNDFTQIFQKSKIHSVFFTGKTSQALWKKHCSNLYEEKFGLTLYCLPSTSPANARFSLEELVENYKIIVEKIT